MTDPGGIAELPFVIVTSKVPCASLRDRPDARLRMSSQATKKLPISVCVISGAEVHRIRRALESVAAWSNEIIVVLNEDVRDGTDAVAEGFGAKVFRESWKGFIGQKQSAAEKATQPWLLNLDADEVITPELANEICQAVISPTTAHAAYEFPRLTFYCGRWIRHGDWYPDRVLRLWQRGKAHWAGQEPHARLEVTGAVGRLRSDVLHNTNENLARQIGNIVPYQTASVKQCLEKAQSAGWTQHVLRPAWRFFRAYFVRLGFLDGWRGFYIAALNAFSVLTRYAMVREARQEKNSD